MKPAAFEYVRPNTVAEALTALATYGGDAKVLAGGQSLVPMLNFRLLSPKILVDINGIQDLDFIEEASDGGLRIGALTRHYSLMTAAVVRSRFPVLSEALRHVAHMAIRNRGTIGGSLSHADPTAELPMMAVLLDATIRVAGAAGMREIAAREFFTGALTTALGEGELLTQVMVPRAIGSGWGFREFAIRAGDFALAAVGVVLDAAEGKATDVRLAVTGVGATPLRILDAEAALRGRAVQGTAIRTACAIVREAVQPPDDLHASSAYRRHLIGGLVSQALEDAWRRAQASAGKPT